MQKRQMDAHLSEIGEKSFWIELINDCNYFNETIGEWNDYKILEDILLTLRFLNYNG